jgi:hypothetical protein
MKKILLSLMMVCSIVIVNAQALLNELYTDPNTGRSEFFELYNIAPVGSVAQNLNCYTLVTYYEEGNGGNKKYGFYVLDFPNLSVAPKQWFVGAAAYPFNTQNSAYQNVIPDFSWNSPEFRNGSTGGSLTKWQLNAAGTGYTQILTSADSVMDFLASGQGSSGSIYAVMLFRDGAPENFFFGGMTSGMLPSDIANLPDLPINMAGACSDFTIDFGALGQSAEFKGNVPGTDNGYARKADGQCGAWDKTSSQLNHTPGASNGSASGLTGSLLVANVLFCGAFGGDTAPRVEFNVTGFTGDITFADDFPIQVYMYYDNGSIPGTLDGNDELHTYYNNLNQLVFSKSVSDTAIATKDSFHLKEGYGTTAVILVYRSDRGCFERVVPLDNPCSALPVSLLSFNATRNRSVVDLSWETAMEDNNKGFYVQRKIGAGEWINLGFVYSKSLNGNSSSRLSYQFTDATNTTKGVTQYRLKQIDIDGKSAYSPIRSVRADGQKGKTIVYPNPSSDGKVNIVFEDAKGARDVQVMDMSGRTIKQWKAITTNNITVDNLNAGFYTVRIVDNETGEQVVEKFVVNKR